MTSERPTLFPHQEAGVEFLQLVKRVILADQTGLGKTITALASAKGRTLIVCPKNVGSKWVQVAGLYGPTVGILGDNKKQKAKQALEIQSSTQFVVTNYETLSASIPELDKGDWETIIVDEAQHLQGRKSIRSCGLKKLTKKAKQVFLLTATPIWNQPDSLWNLLNILYPAEYTSYWSFVYKFCDVRKTPFGTEIKGPRKEMTGELRKLLIPFLLRREKHEVLDLAAKVEKEVWLDVDKRLPKESRQLRKTMRDYGRLSLERTRVHLLDRDNFDFQDEERLYATKIPSAKETALADVLARHEGEKILVFVSYRRSAEIARRWATASPVAAQLSRVPLTGAISVEEREKLIQEFSEAEGTAVLVGTCRALGTGIDGLQCATVAVFLEHPSMFTELDQAIGRIERIGSTVGATIYHLIQRGTLDEKVWRACKSRQEISEAVLMKVDGDQL